MSPFKDQIAPHVCRLLLLKKKKKQQQGVFLSFRFKRSLKIYAPGLVTSGSQQRHVFFGLFLKTLPGFDASHLHLSCYTGTDNARGMDTVPCGIGNKCRDNATGFWKMQYHPWCHWCPEDRRMSTNLRQLQTLKNPHNNNRKKTFLITINITNGGSQ